MWQKIMHEPVAFQALLQALIAAGVAFGLKLTSQEMGAILAATAAMLAFLTRQAVTPIAKLGPGFQVDG
jgi:hypothetical protein